MSAWQTPRFQSPDHLLFSPAVFAHHCVHNICIDSEINQPSFTTCPTAHSFLYLEVRGRSTLLPVWTKQINWPPKTWYLKHNLHHAYHVLWEMTSQFLTFCLPNWMCIWNTLCHTMVLAPRHNSLPSLAGTIIYLLSLSLSDLPPECHQVPSPKGLEEGTSPTL